MLNKFYVYHLFISKIQNNWLNLKQLRLFDFLFINNKLHFFLNILFCKDKFFCINFPIF